jgi:hypothetical protein
MRPAGVQHASGWRPAGVRQQADHDQLGLTRHTVLVVLM